MLLTVHSSIADVYRKKQLDNDWRQQIKSYKKTDRQKQIEDLELAISKEEKIRQKANELLDTYENQLDPRVYQLAKKEVENSGKQETPQIEEAKPAAPKKKVVKRRRLEN